MSENEMLLQWGELRKGERSYQATIGIENTSLNHFVVCHHVADD